MNRSNRMTSSLLLSGLLLACGSSSPNEKAPTRIPDDSALVENLEPAPTPAPLARPPRVSSMTGELWVDEGSQAALDARNLGGSSAELVRRIQYIASQPQAQWMGEWSGDGEQAVRSMTRQANGKILTLVVYNIPFRDCGSYSSGGSKPEEYRRWVESIARGLGSEKAMVILEPDALAQIDCLPGPAQSERLSLLKDAVRILKKAPGARVYLDGGHPAWKPVDVMAERLLQAGVMAADGFALNVSNFQKLEANISYGRTLRSRLAGKNFVIDTSRNGRGPDPDGVWCNPRSRALGRPPTLKTGTEGVDAYLWVKRPGESDGSCNGGPGAGQWWREIALEMAQEAGI